MALGNTAESDLLKLLLQNTNWANLGDATGVRGSSTAGSLYVSLHTAALTGSSSQTTSEAGYTGYSRQAVARSSGGWTVSGSGPTTGSNAATITFGTCSGAPETEQAACIGRDSLGAGEVLFFGALSANFSVIVGATPFFPIGTLVASML